MPSLGFEMNAQNGNLEVDHNKQMVQLAINLQKLQMGGYDAQEINPRRSQNVTESVRVPSSEHVAEIVGRQGCKIKSLRTKTNTYIKTPVRGEEPMFVVTGHAEDVALAKNEIMSTADHFTKIRANRRNNGAPNSRPEDVTIKVPVIVRFVGLLVGSKGATIKNIQQKTDTYIITPSRDKEPVFEVRGLPQNVLRAQELMYEHIYERTGLRMDDPLIQAGLRQNMENPFGFAPNSATLSLLAQNLQNDNHPLSQSDLFSLNTNYDSSNFSPNLFGTTGINSEIDEGFGGSPAYDNPTTPDSSKNIWSPTDDKNLSNLLAPSTLKIGSSGMPPRVNSLSASSVFPPDLNYDGHQQHDSMSTMSYSMSELSSAVSSVDSSPVFGNGPANLLQRKHCFVCQEKDIVPALIVPCGHSMFCYQCANQILNKSPECDRTCPVCQSKVEQLVQIRA